MVGLNIVTTCGAECAHVVIYYNYEISFMISILKFLIKEEWIMNGSIISKRFLRGQIWHWIDPIYGAKKKGDESNSGIYLKEATQRFNRYVLIVQNDRTIDNKSILVMPLTTKKKYESDIEINIRHAQIDGITYIRPRLIFPVSPMSLSSYVCTLSDTDMKVIEEHLYYLTMSLSSGPVSELYEKDANSSSYASDYSQIDQFFDTFVIAEGKQSVNGQDMFNAYRKYCIMNKLTISNTLVFINRINHRLYGNSIPNNAKILKDVTFSNVRIKDIVKLKEVVEVKSNVKEEIKPSPYVPRRGKSKNSYFYSDNNDASDKQILSDVIMFAFENGKISNNMIKKEFKMGYDRAEYFLREVDNMCLLKKRDINEKTDRVQSARKVAIDKFEDIPEDVLAFMKQYYSVNHIAYAVLQGSQHTELDMSKDDIFVSDYETKGELYAMKKWNLSYTSTRAKYHRLCRVSNRECVKSQFVKNPENISNYIDLDNARIAEVICKAVIDDKDISRKHLGQLLNSDDPMKVDAVIRTMTALNCIEVKSNFQTTIVEPLNMETTEFISMNCSGRCDNCKCHSKNVTEAGPQTKPPTEDTQIADIIISNILDSNKPVYEEKLRESVINTIGKGLADQLFIKMAELKIIWPKNDRCNEDGSLRIIPKDYKVLTDSAIEFLTSNTSINRYWSNSSSLHMLVVGFNIEATNLENYQKNIEALADKIVTTLKSFVTVIPGKHVKVGKSGSKHSKGASCKMWVSVKDALIIYISEKAGSLYIRNENLMIYPKYYDNSEMSIQSELSEKSLYSTLDKFDFQFTDKYLDIKNNKARIDMLIKEELRKHKVWVQDLKYKQLLGELLKL